MTELHWEPTARQARLALLVTLVFAAVSPQNAGAQGGARVAADKGPMGWDVSSPLRGALTGVTVTAAPGNLSGVSAAGTGAYTIQDPPPGEYTLALGTLPVGARTQALRPPPLPAATQRRWISR